MKRFLGFSLAGAFLLAIPASHLLWGKAHVRLGKVQVCHKGEVISVRDAALAAHHRHGDCQLPACDFNPDNIFQVGDACDSNNAGGDCSGLAEPRIDAGGLTDACPPDTF